MIILRQSEFSGPKESIEEQAARKQYALRHNARVNREYGEALRKVEDEYKDRLPDSSKKWEDYDKKVIAVIDKTETTRGDSLKAAKTVAGDIIGATKYALGPKKVLDVENFGENAKVTVKDRKLRDRVSDFRNGTSALKERYSNYKEGNRLTRGAKIAERIVEKPKESEIEREYQGKLDAINKRYNPRFIKP